MIIDRAPNGDITATEGDAIVATLHANDTMTATGPVGVATLAAMIRHKLVPYAELRGAVPCAGPSGEQASRDKTRATDDTAAWPRTYTAQEQVHADHGAGDLTDDERGLLLNVMADYRGAELRRGDGPPEVVPLVDDPRFPNESFAERVAPPHCDWSHPTNQQDGTWRLHVHHLGVGGFGVSTTGIGVAHRPGAPPLTWGEIWSYWRAIREANGMSAEVPGGR